MIEKNSDKLGDCIGDITDDFKLKDLKDVSGLSVSYFSYIINNKKTPTIGSLKKISEAVGLEFYELLIIWAVYEADGNYKLSELAMKKIAEFEKKKMALLEQKE